jgi:Family of unknown function (DUF6134)
MIQAAIAAYIDRGIFGGVMGRQLAAVVFLFVTGSTVAAAANDFPYGRTLAFAIYRNGEEVGHHTLSFQNEGANRTVTVAVDLSVKALGVTAYRYSHNSREMWSGNALQRLDARTDDNGRKFAVRAQRDAKGLMVEREAPPDVAPAAVADQGLQAPEIARERLPAGILPTTNWNVGQVGQSVLLNTQYGTQSHAKITPMGREPVKTASGATIQATRYRYTGDLRMDQWFDDRGRWVKAAFPAFDGSMIEYILQE